MTDMHSSDVPSAESDAWNIAEGKSGGKPSLLRYRPNLKTSLGDARYPNLLSVDWSYEETNASGMPDDSQDEEMRGLEESLQSCLDEDRTAVLAFVRTGSGIRTWCYYVADVSEVGDRIQQVLQPGLPIRLTVENDPEWQELRDVYASCGEES